MRLFFPLLLVSSSAAAQWAAPGTPIVPPPLPVVGSRGTVVTVTPLVPRPTSHACVVELFGRREFTGDTPHPIAVSPPVACPGPWARVVLENDLDVSPGTQYDRTARLTLAGVNLFTGTTMEPDATLPLRWHVERDVTDYAAVFTQNARGSASLVNFVDDDHRGRLSWRARLVFYSADAANPAPRVADLVTPLADGAVELGGGDTRLRPVGDMAAQRRTDGDRRPGHAAGHRRDVAILPTRRDDPGAISQQKRMWGAVS